MLLSKQSYLPYKLLKILMVFVLVFSLTLQKPKEANAFPLALLLPVITNPAAVTAALGVLGIGSVGALSSDWYNDNIDQLEQVAIDTAGLMSGDMLENFEKSLFDLQNGLVTSLDLSGDFISTLIDNVANYLNSATPEISGITKTSGISFNLPSNANLLLNINSEQIQSVSSNIEFQIDGTNSVQNFKLRFNNTVYTIATYTSHTIPNNLDLTNQYVAMRNDPTTDFYDFFFFYANIANVSNASLGLKLNDEAWFPGANNTLELDNVGDYLTNQVLANNNKLGLPLGINDLVNLKTNQGVPLYVNNLGEVVLKDGRPFEGDLSDIVVSHNVPQVIDHAGTLTPTISTDFGAVDIITGGIVIPNPNPPTPNLPPNIKPESTRPPVGIQRFLPAALVLAFVLFLKAIVMYAIRLFDYLLSIPFTPTKPIDNYAFQWFKNADILGIEVYNTVIAFATFCFSFTIYKVIRRIW